MLLADLPGSANANVQSMGRSGRHRESPAPLLRCGMARQCRRLVACGLMLGLVACGELGAEPDAATMAAPPPELADVPPRPRLTYSVEQRRQIAEALIADRDNARYDRAAVRYELGLDLLPPAGARPPRVAEPEPPPGGVPVLPDELAPRPPVPGGGALAEALVNQQLVAERNNGELQNFLRILERQRALDRQLAAAGLSRPADPWPEPLPGAPSPVEAPEPPADAVSVPFEAGSSMPSPAAEPALREALAAARAAERRLAVVGHGPSPRLALERARAVAKWLMQLGAAADMLAVQGGGAGETVLVYGLAA
jgi:outer membrane protein OmpA-like peptidoglycan-associated protein